jgi:hypothetical protein
MTTEPKIQADGQRQAEPKYHYGDMTVVRPSKVAYAKDRKAATLRNALTDQHPAYRQFEEAWNDLTDGEMAQVGDIISRGYCNGFAEVTEARP